MESYNIERNKKLVKFLRFAILVLSIVAVIYFWSNANRWEDLLLKDWSRDPLLSNASATLEYVKALVKIVITGVIATIAMLYLKNSCCNDIKHDA